MPDTLQVRSMGCHLGPAWAENPRLHSVPLGQSLWFLCALKSELLAAIFDSFWLWVVCCCCLLCFGLEGSILAWIL